MPQSCEVAAKESSPEPDFRLTQTLGSTTVSRPGSTTHYKGIPPGLQLKLDTYRQSPEALSKLKKRVKRYNRTSTQQQHSPCSTGRDFIAENASYVTPWPTIGPLSSRGRPEIIVFDTYDHNNSIAATYTPAAAARDSNNRPASAVFRTCQAGSTSTTPTTFSSSSTALPRRKNDSQRRPFSAGHAGLPARPATADANIFTSLGSRKALTRPATADPKGLFRPAAAHPNEACLIPATIQTPQSCPLGNPPGHLSAGTTTSLSSSSSKGQAEKNKGPHRLQPSIQSPEGCCTNSRQQQQHHRGLSPPRTAPLQPRAQSACAHSSRAAEAPRSTCKASAAAGQFSAAVTAAVASAQHGPTSNPGSTDAILQASAASTTSGRSNMKDEGHLTARLPADGSSSKHCNDRTCSSIPRRPQTAGARLTNRPHSAATLSCTQRQTGGLLQLADASSYSIWSHGKRGEALEGESWDESGGEGWVVGHGALTGGFGSTELHGAYDVLQ